MSSRDLTVVMLVILGALVLLPVLGMLFMGPGMMGPMMGQWMGPGMMGRGMGGGGWWGVGLVVLAAVAIVALLSRRASADDALAVLKRRLAKGEITPEQYADLKNTLQQP